MARGICAVVDHGPRGYQRTMVRFKNDKNSYGRIGTYDLAVALGLAQTTVARLYV